MRITLADVPPTELADFAAKESQHSVAAVSAVHTPEGGAGAAGRPWVSLFESMVGVVEH